MRKLLTVSSILTLLVTGTVSGADISSQVNEVKSAEQENVSEDFSYQNSFLNFLYNYFINGSKITNLDNKKDFYYYLNENTAYFFSKEVPLDSEFTVNDYFRYKDTIRQDGIEVLKWEGTDFQNYLKSETKHFLANLDSSWIPQPSGEILKGKYNTAVELFKINQQALRLGVLIGEKRKIDKQAYTLLALENAYREVCGEVTNHGEHVDFDYGTEKLPDSYTEAYSMDPLYNFLKNACETYLSVGSSAVVKAIGQYVAEYNRMKMYSFGTIDPAGVVFSCGANVIYCPNSGYEPMVGTYCIYNPDAYSLHERYCKLIGSLPEDKREQVEDLTLKTQQLTYDYASERHGIFNDFYKNVLNFSSLADVADKLNPDVCNIILSHNKFSELTKELLDKIKDVAVTAFSNEMKNLFQNVISQYFDPSEYFPVPLPIWSNENRLEYRPIVSSIDYETNQLNDELDKKQYAYCMNILASIERLKLTLKENRKLLYNLTVKYQDLNRSEK